MKTIERRIKQLEGKAGLDKEITLVRVKNYLNGNPECPAFDGSDSRCIRFKEFCRNPRVNENGFAIFWLDCEGCKGVQV